MQQSTPLRDAAEAKDAGPKDADAGLRETLDRVRAAAEKGGLQLTFPDEDSLFTAENSDKALSKSQRDFVVAIAALCELSTKDGPNGSAEAANAKHLALDLIKALLQKHGAMFRTSESFIAVVKNRLCVSLIKNSVFGKGKINTTSLQIIVLLVKSFNEHLKAEIGIFIEDVILRILESGNSSYHHKLGSLQVCNKLCTDAPTALELFVNFDCNVDQRNIFERMVDCLSKIAQGKYTSSEHATLIQPNEERNLSLLALKTVVSLMGSLLDFAKKHPEEPRRPLAQPPPGGSSASDAPASPSAAKAPASGSGANSDAEEHADSSTRLSVMHQKQRKRDLATGVSKFNLKPKRGIEHLRQSGFVTEDPGAMAEFFKKTDIGLDKTAIGDFLGEDKPFNVNVLNSLVDGLSFVGMEVDAALHMFLAIFRLPGEAQKVSRMMEKFAEKYSLDNEGKYSSADVAFVLCFSLIMLQTDLHNPGVKNKMTKDEFVNNNRGIDDGKNLPREHLEFLYDNVRNNPMSLREDEEQRAKLESQAAQGAQQKSELFVKESQNIVQTAQSLLKQRASCRQDRGNYAVARSAEHISTLFETVCWPMLATLSVLVELHDDTESVEQCMAGFRHCIRIATHFDMGTERDAVVSSLAKFTYLTTIKEIKPKNIECLKALLDVGLSEGNGLGPSSFHVLHCVSQLERLELMSRRSKPDFQFFADGHEGEGASHGRPPHSHAAGGASEGTNSASTVSSGNQILKRRAYGTGATGMMTLDQEQRQIEVVNSEVVMSQIDATQIDLLFNKSARLEASAIVHFVRQLARVSQEELALADQPRKFSLQKLVEVAASNMSRPPAVWSQIWKVLRQHFVEVAGHPNQKVGVYAIDSLRQLAIKFLESTEMSKTTLQADFLGAFEAVMIGTPSTHREVKELVVSSISYCVQNHIKNIKSGWKTVFNILNAAVQEHGHEVAPETAFEVVEKVVDHHYHLFVEYFGDGIRALLAFGQCQANVEISLQAVTYLRQAAEYLADRNKPKPPPPPTRDEALATTPTASASVQASFSESQGPLTQWFHILRGLQMLVSDKRAGVRQAALTGLFHCLRDHGVAVFDEDMWRMVHKGVVKPLFEDVLHQLQMGDDALTPIVSGVVLRGLRDLPEEHVARCMPELFPMVCKLVCVNSPEIRQMVQDILLEQVQPLITRMSRTEKADRSAADGKQLL